MSTVDWHIHVMGAPGAGTSTLGKQLALALGSIHLDTDDYHWFTSDPEYYRRRRNPDHRRALLTTDLEQYPSWVLSGSLCGWGDPFTPLFNAVVFCNAPAEVRLERIRQRELARYGPERLSPNGGDLYTVFMKFLDWAAAYESDTGRMRSLAFEREWVARHIQCPVFWADTSTACLEEIIGQLRTLTEPSPCPTS